jgi:hypothetical protein
MTRPAPLKHFFCFQRSNFLDHMNGCCVSLCEALTAVSESVRKSDLGAVQSNTQEARLIREHMAFLREEFDRHRQQHGC